MKRSAKPTAYLLLLAGTTSEWDVCDFAIVRLDDVWKIRMSGRLQLVSQFKKDVDFSHVAWSDNVEGFYTCSESTVGIMPRKEEAWCFIDTTGEELQDLEEVNTELTACEFKIDGGGYASFRAFAEQNDDSFYTHDFKIQEILNRI
jgi:hypothetical protein